jgi:predicted permease
VKWVHAVRARIGLLLRPRAAEARIDEEFRFHVDMMVSENLRAGMAPAEARRQALLAFGGADRHKERMRDERGARWLGDLISDSGYALRTLRRAPGFAAAAVVTLAIGLGVTTAIGSVLHTVVLAPAPYAEPDHVVQIARERGERRTLVLPPADVARLREATSEFLTLGVARFNDVALGTAESTVRVRGTVVTGSTLSMLGVPPLLGRLPAAADDVPGGACVAVLSFAVWSEHFAADPALVGGSVRLNGMPCTVTGVMPEGFAYPAPYFAPGELWLLAGPENTDWSAEAGPGFLVFGRLAGGRDLAEVRAALGVLSARDESTAGRLTAMRWAAPSREASRERLLILLAAAALVLVIGYVNFVMLQLARTVDRREELATRRALGATPGRLIRLMLAETGVLTIAGALGGLVVAKWSVDLIIALRSFMIPRMEEVAIGGGATAMCFGLAALGGAVAAAVSGVGLVPGRGPGVARFSRSVTRGRGGRHFGRGLVLVETTLTLILLAGAALLAQSYRNLSALDPGFRSTGVLHARVALPQTRYPDDASRAAFYAVLEDRVASVPGIRDAALTWVAPGVGAGAEQSFAIAGREPAPGMWPTTVWRPVSGGYFRALDVPLVRGRSLEGHRGAAAAAANRGALDSGSAGAAAMGGPREAVVNRAFVRRYLQDTEPLGQRLHLVPSVRADAAEPEAWTIVGVVEDVREEYVYREPPPAVYVHYSDQPRPSMVVLARTAGSPLALSQPLREVVAGLDPDLPVFGIRDLDYILRSEYDLNRLGMALLALFAGAALVLAIAGIYGVVSHQVAQRLREMGIRIALGAKPADVLRLIVGESGRFAAIGVVGGLMVVGTVGHLLGALTPGWTGVSRGVVAAVAIAVATVAVGAAYLPARRAASADPLETLRQE